jgi:CheY-like chemotaxis protein
VFLDIGLPGKMDGIAVLRELRQDPRLKSTHVVIVSGRHPRSLDQKDVLHADAYITKPFNKQDLHDWYQGYKTGWRRWLNW